MFLAKNFGKCLQNVIALHQRAIINLNMNLYFLKNFQKLNIIKHLKRIKIEVITKIQFKILFSKKILSSLENDRYLYHYHIKLVLNVIIRILLYTNNDLIIMHNRSKK